MFLDLSYCLRIWIFLLYDFVSLFFFLTHGRCEKKMDIGRMDNGQSTDFTDQSAFLSVNSFFRWWTIDFSGESGWWFQRLDYLCIIMFDLKQ